MPYDRIAPTMREYVTWIGQIMPIPTSAGRHLQSEGHAAEGRLKAIHTTSPIWHSHRTQPETRAGVLPAAMGLDNTGQLACTTGFIANATHKAQLLQLYAAHADCVSHVMLKSKFHLCKHSAAQFAFACDSHNTLR